MILSACILCKLVRALHPARHLLSLLFLLFLLFHLLVICTHHGGKHQAQKGALLKKIINFLLSGTILNLGIPCNLEHWVLLPQARRNPSIKEGHPQRDCSNLMVITNFWSIVQDDHWSKKISRTQMIVDVRCYIHLRWSCSLSYVVLMVTVHRSPYKFQS